MCHFKQISFLLFFSFTLLFCSSGSIESIEHPIEPTPADQDHFKGPFEINQLLGKGINLGNALEAPNEGDWGMIIQKEFIQLIADAGFESVRIPIRWNAHAMTTSPYTIDSSFFERIDEIIEWSLNLDLSVMINIHHYNELMSTPEQHRSRFLALWSQLADHYKDYPESVLFEALNEPHEHLTSDLWNDYLDDAIRIIRQTNPRRVLVIGTAPWGGFDGLQQLQLPDSDQQIIATVHYYNPFQFTHQGAEWSGPEAAEWLGTTWRGTEMEMKTIDEDFDEVHQWSETHNRPIHLGEFGAYSTADDLSRALWTRYIVQAAETREFSWAYWEFGAGFGIYDRIEKKWRNYLLEALIPDSPEL